MSRYGILICALFSVLLCACHEEAEAPLQFDVIENSTPETTRIRYFANPGPGCMEKEYYVYTDFSESELKLKCNNSNKIKTACRLKKPYASENGGTTTIEATPEETGIYVTLSDDNIITVRFAQLSSESTPYGYYGTIIATDHNGGAERQTVINISRRNPSLDG